jgi:NAD(P)H-dependent FMN reductase
MADSPKILAFAGSSRAGSFNQQALAVAIAGARAAGAEVTHVDLRALELPIYDAELEHSDGLPAGAAAFRRLLLEHRGLLIACPEYNSSITALLKNSIDWATRNEKGQGTVECFDGKVAGLVSASAGEVGGLRGLVHVRAILGNIRVLVIPEQVAVSRAHEAFEPDGRIKDPKRHAAVENVGAAVTKLVAKLSA